VYSGDIMKDKDLLVDRVSKKTNVKKEDIFKLANDLQKKDLNNEKDMRDFIQTVAKVTNQSLDQRKIDKLIKIMQNKDVLNDVEKMI
ncbi:MAG: stage VI sporulation protein F, partial [Faecalibacillus intestinalis]